MVPRWTFGDRVRRARREAGMDRLELAEKLGVSRSTVATWENDRSVPGRYEDVVREIADVTGVDAEWIAGFRTGSRYTGPSDTSDELATPDSLADMDPKKRARARHPTAQRTAKVPAAHGLFPEGFHQQMPASDPAHQPAGSSTRRVTPLKPMRNGRHRLPARRSRPHIPPKRHSDDHPTGHSRPPNATKPRQCGPLGPTRRGTLRAG